MSEPLPLVRQNFPELDENQRHVLAEYARLLGWWNERINLVSRRDMPNFERKHLLPSLAVLRAVDFPADSAIMDAGSGGGLPGLPLAILRPDCRFTLVDSVAKKTRVLEDLVDRLELANVEVRRARIESMEERFDFVTGRALKSLATLCDWLRGRIGAGAHGEERRGLFYLKGGDPSLELDEAGIEDYELFPLSLWIEEPELETKVLIFIPADEINRRRKR
ncbi:16S rRNA (guanine(527)-N(7))-methyltransferase RsmG [Kiritimatiella glycovorans]|uniref:Ribosomal RNA small subunit methyltransferase G n=1 Tax=Kiritimatiella glycovorans TaxID=1307763 RepID=A0A0G3EAN9_9BACT|nr:16S rRNA (guanine(527)-N(7))-methyltransferase RsmG [Kiritimatiella glycovorans]AKJ63318.1 Ribosomal RNA small subunit methyltransferase G [Kiritimatiella glycovorans]